MAKMIKELQFKVLIEQDEDGVFVASAPAIPGCHTQGDTYEKAVKNIEEAIGLCLEEAKENRSYHEKIDWDDTEKDKSRFLGVTEVPVKFSFS